MEYDSLRAKIDWTPASKGGNSVITHDLVEDGDTLWFEPKRIYLAIGFFSIILGISSLIVGFLMDKNTFYFIGVLCLIMSPATFRAASQKIVFDLTKKIFWRGSITKKATDKIKSFDEVIALQIVKEKVVTTSRAGSSNQITKSIFNSYELNVVFSDFSRMTLVDHGNLKLIESNGKKLSSIIDVPLLSQ